VKPFLPMQVLLLLLQHSVPLLGRLGSMLKCVKCAFPNSKHVIQLPLLQLPPVPVGPDLLLLALVPPLDAPMLKPKPTFLETIPQLTTKQVLQHQLLTDISTPLLDSFKKHAPKDV